MWSAEQNISQAGKGARVFHKIPAFPVMSLSKILETFIRPFPSPFNRKYVHMVTWTIMHQSIPPAPSPPPPPIPLLLRGICPSCQSRGWGICKFCTARGPGICQPPGHSRAFDTHAVSYQNIITTQKVLLGKKQIGSSVKDTNKL